MRFAFALFFGLFNTLNAIAQDTIGLESEFNRIAQINDAIRELKLLDSAVKYNLDPNFINSLKKRGLLSFLVSVKTIPTDPEKYRYDSLIVDFNSIENAAYNYTRKRAWTTSLFKLEKEGSLRIGHGRGPSSTIDDFPRSSSDKKDGNYYLAHINQIFRDHRQELILDKWDIDRYFRWESSKNPVNDFNRMIIRKSFLSFLKKRYGYEF